MTDGGPGWGRGAPGRPPVRWRGWLTAGSRRLHFKSESDAHRRKIVETIAGLDVGVVIYDADGYFAIALLTSGPLRLKIEGSTPSGGLPLG